MRSASSHSHADRRAPSSLVLKDTFVTRIAGLPVQSLLRLRFTQTLQQVDQLRQLEEYVVEQEKALAERLHPLVATFAGIEHKQVRNRLIELRRAFFQGRLPRAQLLRDDILETLPTDVVAEIHACYQLRKKIQQVSDEARVCFEQELRLKRQELFVVARQEPLLRGLILASQSLYREIFQGEGSSEYASEQKLERSLISYIMRATAKTSPYSTFTSSAPGRWLLDETAQNDCVIRARADGDNWIRQSRVEANLLIMQQIAQVVIEWSEVRATLTLSINSTLMETEQTLFFLARQPQGTEALVHLGNNATVKRILSLVRHMQPATYGALLQQLVGVHWQERGQAVERFLEQLIAKGLLQLDFAIPEQAPDYLGQLIGRLSTHRQVRVQALVHQLKLLQNALHAYEQLSSLDGCFELAQSIQSLLQDIYAEVHLELTLLPTKNLFYENSTLPEIQLLSSSAAWQETEKNLGYLQRLVGLYDPFLAGRLALTAFFVERYADQSEVDLLSFYETFYKESLVTGEGEQRTEAALIMQLFTMPFFIPTTSNPALQQLADRRHELAQWLDRQPIDKNGTRRLPLEELATLLDESASVLQVPQSLAYYCQIYADDRHFQVMINALQSGFGRTFGRLHAARGIAPALSEQRVDDTDPLVVSIQGVFGSNINVRSETTRYEIVYPGQVSSRPAEEQIPFSDLVVGYNAETRRLCLRSRRLQRTLLPVHLGMMSDYWLPPMYRFLLWAFADAPADPLWGLRLIDIPTLNMGINEGIRAAPRVFLGNICLYRAHWLVAGNAVPHRAKGAPDFDYFLHIQRWCQDNSLPQQCFIRVNAFDFAQRASFQMSVTHTSAQRTKRKPLYIDFANYFSVMMFERIAEQSEFGLLLEEVLPALETQVMNVASDAYVSEYIFEVERKG